VTCQTSTGESYPKGGGGTGRGKDPDVEHGRLGRNLRHLLGLHDVSQQDLARYLGLSPQGLWNILHGRSEPRSRTAHALAVAFGVSLDVLFADTGTCVRAAAGVFERAPVRAIADPVVDPGETLRTA
jgi:transcriptional regulator with XRE-family HTH domain